MFKVMKNENELKGIIESGIEISQFVYYFDVWGNEDGYEVNNLCTENLFILGDYGFEDVVKLLRKSGFAKKGARINNATCGDIIEIETTGGFPVGRMDSDYFYSEDMKTHNNCEFMEKIDNYYLSDTYGNSNMVVMMHV